MKAATKCTCTREQGPGVYPGMFPKVSGYPHLHETACWLSLNRNLFGWTRFMQPLRCASRWVLLMVVNSHCERCGVCSYQFHCSCSEAYKAGVSCVHLHAVATFGGRSETPLLRESANDDNSKAGSEGTGTISSESIDIADEGANENEEPRDILEEDRTKQAYQLVEGRISHLSELMRCCRREEQYEVLEERANALQEVINLMPSNLGSFSRRQEMQTTGSGPRPKPIQFKSKSLLKFAFANLERAAWTARMLQP
ncbi:unnamed protein product [Cylicocyclus nassatus]|uniref:SWIM-type domain-containing protein n=1 Tax=Cylicocyclus nassatus TaxID=53992 RepID=A0AA36GXL5_CYLNA|nr:unnamed protein product [Cylicocyclus nassatus]